VSDRESVADAKARAERAKAREIEAHRRAIELQEKAAAMFDRVHYSEEARNAQQRADRAREMLRQALAEQESAGDEL
jgi:hypothetical protein